MTDFEQLNEENTDSQASGFLTDDDGNASGFITEDTAGQDFNSPFTEVRKLESRGAMADIYSAVHLGRRKVIIKRIKEEFRNNPEYKSLFYKEFDTGYALDNPNVVRFYGKGEDAAGAYYYMEYVDGRTLSDYLKEGHGLRIPEVTRIVLQLLEGLKYMHAHQVFHRDLKPENIMLTFKGDNVKIIDLGLAADDTIVDNLKNAGTPKYAAPELLNDARAADQRSDIYSFGLILLEIFTGSPDRRFLPQINSGIFRQIADKATMKFPSDRYHSCDEIISLLKSSSSSEVSSSPVPKWLEDKIKDYASDGFISRNERIVLDREIEKSGADKKIVEAMLNDEIEKAVLRKRKAETERRRNEEISLREEARSGDSMRRLFRILLWVILGLLVVFGGIKWYKTGFRMPEFSEKVLQEEFKRGDKAYVKTPTELVETVGGKVIMQCSKNQEVEVIEALYQYVEVKTAGKRGYIDKRYLSHYK